MFVVLLVAYIVVLGLLLPYVLDGFGGIGAAIFGIVFTLGWFALIGIGANYDQARKFSFSIFKTGLADGAHFLGTWIVSLLALLVAGFVLFLFASAFG